MKVKFRKYTDIPGITEDYKKVREFMIELGYSEYNHGRWDWRATHSYLNKETVGKTGLWEDGDKLVGVVTNDLGFGTAFCLALPEYKHLKREMLLYAKENLNDGDKFGVMIPDTDLEFQKIAAELGFIATPYKESDAILNIDQTPTDYELPEGFKIVSLKDEYEPYQYGRVLWKGFNHELDGEGEYDFTTEEKTGIEESMIRPNVDLNLKIAVVSPEGNFVSYCGMWYDEEAGYSVVEPVATDPDYRKMGLGKAAVLEGIKRTGELGAKYAIVGSTQQFYYSIGMRPYTTVTRWIERK